MDKVIDQYIGRNFAFYNGDSCEVLQGLMKQGRVVCIHCMDLPSLKMRDGFIGLKDFPGEIIRIFEDVGFIYHSKVCIWKNPRWL